MGSAFAFRAPASIVAVFIATGLHAAPPAVPDVLGAFLQGLDTPPALGSGPVLAPVTTVNIPGSAAPPLAQPPAATEPDELELLLLHRGLLAPPTGFALPEPIDKASEMVVAAMGFLGRPYTWGGTTWEGGFDCSGFVQAIHRQSAGVRLPRSAAEQASATQPIERGELRPGDLVFFNTSRREFSHVGIYVGDHRFIHAPTAGSAIRMADMRLDYWDRRFNGARRAIQPPDTAGLRNGLSGADR